MKKVVVIIVIIWIAFTMMVHSQAKKEESKNKDSQANQGIITKTYILKNISPQVVQLTLNQYFYGASYDSNGNMFTAKIPRENIVRFEELLRQLDVEKKRILIRIFTVIASQDNRGSEIQNRELKQVLSELQKVLSFNSYRLDGVSAITVMDGQRSSTLTLSSQTPLRFSLDRINLRGNNPGTREIAFRFQLSQKQEVSAVGAKDNQVMYDTLIESESSVKENGYLVAGVSKIGRSGDSLVLIINAEMIK
jgi:hypothetical protein